MGLNHSVTISITLTKAWFRPCSFSHAFGISHTVFMATTMLSSQEHKFSQCSEDLLLWYQNTSLVNAQKTYCCNTMSHPYTMSHPLMFMAFSLTLSQLNSFWLVKSLWTRDHHNACLYWSTASAHHVTNEAFLGCDLVSIFYLIFY